MSGGFVGDTPRIRGAALIASVVFHIAIFYALGQMEMPGPRPFMVEGVGQPVRITVELITARSSGNSPPLTVADPSPLIESSENPIGVIEAPREKKALAAPAVPETNDSRLPSGDAKPVEPARVLPEPIDTHLLNDDTQDSLAGVTSQTASDTGPQAGAFGNVFDPRLRRRLQQNHRQIPNEGWGGPREVRDVHGDRRVALGNERCMMAKQSMRSGEATNWHLTSCGGLDEGEKMLRRVEQSLREPGE